MRPVDGLEGEFDEVAVGRLVGTVDDFVVTVGPAVLDYG